MYNPPIRGREYICYRSLTSQANAKVFQANPTLAAGDVKICKDDGAPANLGTLPVVDGDHTKRVKITVSATEMEADNVSILFSDAAGDEWCDLEIQIQPTNLIGRGTVDSTNFTPTVTEFEADDVLEATADHYKGRVILFTSGALKEQACEIADYALVSSRGHFTVTALTEAPGNNDTFVIL